MSSREQHATVRTTFARTHMTRDRDRDRYTEPPYPLPQPVENPNLWKTERSNPWNPPNATNADTHTKPDANSHA